MCRGPVRRLSPPRWCSYFSSPPQRRFRPSTGAPTYIFFRHQHRLPKASPGIGTEVRLHREVPRLAFVRLVARHGPIRKLDALFWRLRQAVSNQEHCTKPPWQRSIVSPCIRTVFDAAPCSEGCNRRSTSAFLCHAEALGEYWRWACPVCAR